MSIPPWWCLAVFFSSLILRYYRMHMQNAGIPDVSLLMENHFKMQSKLGVPHMYNICLGKGKKIRNCICSTTRKHVISWVWWRNPRCFSAFVRWVMSGNAVALDYPYIWDNVHYIVTSGLGLIPHIHAGLEQCIFVRSLRVLGVADAARSFMKRKGKDWSFSQCI